MLETIREFGLEQLKPNEEVAIRVAHAQYFLHLTQALQRLLRTRSTSDPLTRLAADEANLRAAYDWFEERGPAADFAAIAAASYTFWYALGRMRDATAALERALCNRDYLSTAEGARLLIGKGEMLLAQGEAARAAQVLAEGLPVVRAVGEAFDVAQALVVCGASWNYAEKYTDGDAYLAEALAVAETIADPTLRSATAGRALANLSVTARGLGKLALAEARCAEALRRYHEFGLDMAEIRVRMDLANIAIEQGDYQLAAERYLTCIEQIGDRGDMYMAAHALTGIGTAAIVWGQPQPAALLIAAAEALRERVGTAILLPHDRVISERNRAALLSALGAEGFATTWAEGQRLSLSRAVTIAQSVTPADRPFAAPPGRPDDRLTRRQVEVLRLMARWQTDREIADALFMSPRTASWHVHTILEKLGAQSRGEAVDLARAAGLL
jgi:DNA-binding NarL/FixJ family response regulator